MNSSNERKAREGYADASTAFLLTQVGAAAAMSFGERIAKIGLAPQHAGILMILGLSPGLSQRALAKRLRMLPSRLVALVDELEEKGLVERRRDPGDRRTHALHLTEAGASATTAIGDVAREHDGAVCAALTAEEKTQLTTLLARIAEQQRLTPGVHPGYKHLDGAKPPCAPSKQA